jgi:Ca2+-binding RTX toxin-like protein
MRVRISSVPVLLLVAAAPLVSVSVSVASPADAAQETCQGHPATIVWDGPPGGGVHGEATDGDDVIVANLEESMVILAGDGDDLICVFAATDDRLQVPVVGGEGHDSLEVRLGDGGDMLQTIAVEDLDVTMGGGFDQVKTSQAFGTGSIDGGPDGATLHAFETKSVTVDLVARTLSTDGDVGTYTIRRFTRVDARARRVDVTGNAKANGVQAYGCRVTIRGGAGDDVLTHIGSPANECESVVRLLGQAGDDRLRGDVGDDVLIGGPGVDTASGGRGGDRCVAEKKRNCER